MCDIKWEDQPRPECAALVLIGGSSDGKVFWAIKAADGWTEYGGCDDGIWRDEDENKYYRIHHKPEDKPYMPKIGEVCEVLDTSFTAGTIEDAPMELEDGEWYMCKAKDSNDVWESSLMFSGGLWYLRRGATAKHLQVRYEVTPMHKMVKA